MSKNKLTAFLYRDEHLTGDLFIREIMSRHHQDSIVITIVLGPTPLPIRDNPEEFNNEIQMTVVPGTPLRKLIDSLMSVDMTKKDISAWNMATH